MFELWLTYVAIAIFIMIVYGAQVP